jgi:hypothetical protein
MNLLHLIGLRHGIDLIVIAALIHAIHQRRCKK